MEKLAFKTNIKCGGCIETVTPFLNQDQSIESWKVDLTSPQRVLEVQTDRTAQEISDLLKKAGYSAEEIPA